VEEKLKYNLIHDYARTIKSENIIWEIDESELEAMRAKVKSKALPKIPKKRKREGRTEDDLIADDASDSSLDDMISSLAKRASTDAAKSALAEGPTHLDLEEEFEVEVEVAQPKKQTKRMGCFSKLVIEVLNLIVCFVFFKKKTSD